MRKRKSLGRRMIIVMTLIALFGGVPLSVIAVVNIQNLIVENLTTNAEISSNNLSHNIDLFLKENIVALENFAEFDDVKELNIATIYNMLASMNKHYDQFAVIFLTDTNGQQIARSDDGELSDLSDRAYLKDVKEKNETIISDIIISKTTGKPAVVVITPVKTNAGSVVGYVAGTLDLSVLEAMRAQIKIGDTGYAFVTDSLGGVLVHPEQSVVDERTDVSDLPVVAKALNGETSSGDYEYNGARTFGSYTYVPTTGWAVVVRQDYAEAMSRVNDAILKAIVITLGILAVAITIGVIFSRRMIKPIVQLREAAMELAEGKLNIEINIQSDDEIGDLKDAFVQMKENLSNLVGRMLTTSNRLNAASTEMIDSSSQISNVAIQISDAVTGVAEGNSDQAGSIQNILIEMKGVANSNEEIMTSSLESAESVAQTLEFVNKGVQTVNMQGTQMAQSVGAVGEVTDIINSLNEKMAMIEAIIGSIQNISDQTNLLALNAAIEAARAGEQGRGFAVVADEVRKLAEESKKSTEEIARIMSDIKTTTETAVDKATYATKRIHEQEAAVNETTVAFKAIHGRVDDISRKIIALRDASEASKRAVDKIQLEVESVSAVSEESAASTEEITASVEEQTATIHTVAEEVRALAEISEELKEAIGHFKI